jgi:hypothetical protein
VGFLHDTEILTPFLRCVIFPFSALSSATSARRFTDDVRLVSEFPFASSVAVIPSSAFPFPFPRYFSFIFSFTRRLEPVVVAAPGLDGWATPKGAGLVDTWVSTAELDDASPKIADMAVGSENVVTQQTINNRS